MKFLALMTASAGLALPAHAAFAQPTNDSTIWQTDYYCERNIIIPVTYINTPDGASFAVINVDGKQVSMAQAVSGSGARYVAINEQDSYRWHEKSGEAVLSYLEADDSAKEQTLLTQCRSGDLGTTDE